MHILNRKWFAKLFIIVLGILLFSLPAHARANDASNYLEITGDGVTNPVTFTLQQLEAMPQHQYIYSAINTWPTKKWYVGKGVKLSNLLDKAGLKEDAKLVRFTSSDGYTMTLTVDELLKDRRYCFPNFRNSNDFDGHIPGSSAGAVEVDAIIGLISVEGSNNPDYMTDMNSPMLMLGQRAVTEQTGNLFVKYLNKIEVLTAEPKKWDEPQANPSGGTVPAGTMVALSNANSDDDKIYYTTDGSTPTLESPMYNWIAKRWWAARADVLGTINHPIGPINEDTTIKAITIGPGKLNSDVVTFHYRVADDEVPDKQLGKIIGLTIGRVEASVDGASYTLEAAPYVDDKTGRTLVPVRFVSEALGAEVDWDAQTNRITIVDGGKVIVLIIGSNNVQVDGVQQSIECAPTTIPPGRTFIPLRFVSESLGAQVDYEAKTSKITITR
ncbi:stalk domain-containing protein [Desulfofalx alkaliphila]|uniref:stalk domain-containing protein n=1 Tax=Desulfofalx alkaliphila TaxID=105483 RepID=UPI0004E1B579|nr:stalk domain-containing protein [Desulfofalx alkaliphila]